MPATTVKHIIFKVEVDDKEAKKPLLDLKEAFSSAFGSVGSAVDMIKTAFQPLIDFTKNAIGSSISLEDALAGVRKTAGLTSEQVFTLQRQVRDFAVEEMNGMVSAENLASALEIAGQQGVFVGKSFEQGSADALAFAKVMVIAGDVFGGLTTEKAAEQLGLLHGRFSESIPDIERAASVINFFGDTTNRSEGFILNLAGRMAETAGTVKLTEQATFALAATLGVLNQGAEKSGTAMSRILQIMRSDSDAFAQSFGLNAAEFSRLVREDMEGALVMFAEQLQMLGSSQQGVDIILQGMKDMQLTGSGVSSVLQGLGASADTLKQNLADSYEQWNSNTSAMNSFIDGSDRTSKLWQALKNIFLNTVTLVSDQLLPVFKEILKQINAQAVAFREWFVNSEFIKTILPQAMKDLTAQLSGFITRAFEAAKAIDWNDVISRLWTMAKALFTFLTDTLPKIVIFFTHTGDAIKNVKELFGLLEGPIKIVVAAFNVLSEATEPIFQLIVSSLISMTDSTYSFGDVVNDVFGSMVDTVGDVIGAVVNLSSKIIEATKNILGMGDEAYKKSVFPEMEEWAYKVSDSVDTIGASLNTVTDTMAKAGESVAAIAASGGFSADAIRQIMNTTGVMSAQGMNQATQELLRQQYESSPFAQYDQGTDFTTKYMTPQLANATPQTSETPPQIAQRWGSSLTPSTLNATLVVDGQQIGRLTSKITTTQEEQRKYSYGGGLS